MKKYELFADKIESGEEGGLKFIKATGSVVLTWSDDPIGGQPRNMVAAMIRCDEIKIYERKE
jgi:hypothetical protein